MNMEAKYIEGNEIILEQQVVPKWNPGFLKTKAFLVSILLRLSIVKVVCSLLQEGTT